MNRLAMASAGSSGTSARFTSFGTLIALTGRSVLPANCGRYRFSTSSISATMSRISCNVSTADVSGSRATAFMTSSGSPVKLASTIKPWTCTLVMFNAAHWIGKLPTTVGCNPSRSTKIGTSTQHPCRSETGLHDQTLDLHIGHVQCGALDRQIADHRRMQSEPVHKDRHLDAAPLRQIRDVTVVADVPVEAENIPRLLGFDDVRAILGTPRSEFGRFD